ncbi:nucleoside phosphorylase [Mucilaginibacter gracilis]|uniref:Nucleoside phosphorylase n=1 Tax=Mucilaginibacter gracilis TaxID=423350 RepID=A0A495IUM3_9SPHI|nr:hypothetical protein [Mucilaginibacter gracilis]RKR80400.1 nucleoside phosphorylase [Mucilaginibacter gracilis]
MTKDPLIIYFHDEKKLAQKDDSEFFNNISRIGKETSIQVTNIEQFTALMNYLDPATDVYVLVHIMGDLKSKNPDKDYHGEAWGLELSKKYEHCNYYFVTTSNNKRPEIIDGRKVYVLNEFYRQAVKNKSVDFPSQTIREINKQQPANSAAGDSNDKTDVDFVILTALYYDEMEEVKSAFNITEQHRFNFGKNVGYYFVFEGNRIVATSQAQMGMVESAILSMECIYKFNPRYLIMPGVCAGEKKTEFGDIIIPNKIHLYQAGKISDDGFEKEVVDVKIDEMILERIKPVEKDIVKEIFAKIKRSKTKKEEFEKFLYKQFSTRVDPMACSTMVVDKKGFFSDNIKTVDRKMVALEMESYGVARSAEKFDNRTKAILIKCVMDKSSKKNDKAKKFAAYVSANFVKKAIEKKIFD